MCGEHHHFYRHLSQAFPLTLGPDNTFSGGFAVTSSTDQDWFALALQAGDRVTITVTVSSSLDAALVLYDPGETRLAMVDEGGAGSSEVLSRFTIAATGTHFIGIGSFESISKAAGAAAGTGAYTLTVSVLAEGDDPAEPNDTRAQAFPLTLGPDNTFSGDFAVTTSVDQDWFKLDLTEGDLISVTVDVSSSLDPRLVFYDPGETKIGDKDAVANGGTEELAGFPIDNTGTHFIGIGFFSSIGKAAAVDAETGAYTLTVTVLPPESFPSEPNDTRAQAFPITLGPDRTFTGDFVISTSIDQDWFALPLIQGEVVTITVDEPASPEAVDTRLVLYDPGETLLSDVDENLPGGYEVLSEFKIATTGTHFIGVGFISSISKAASATANTGSYTLIVTVSAPPPTAAFLVHPPGGTVKTTFTVEGSASSDIADAAAVLEVRWDWESDGTWDTEFSTTKSAKHQYDTPNTYLLTMEVRNTSGKTSTTTRYVAVSQPLAGSGQLTYVEYQLGVQNDPWVTLSPDGRHVYLVTGTYISAWSRARDTGALTFVEFYADSAKWTYDSTTLNDVTVSPDGAHVYVTGRLSRNNNVFAGVLLFARNAATGELTFVEVKGGVNGVGGRNFANAKWVTVSPDGAHVYVTGSTDQFLFGLSTFFGVVVFARNAATGKLTFVEVLKDDFTGVDARIVVVSVIVSPDGANVYAGGSGESVLAVFTRNSATGKLKFVEALKDGVNGVDGLTMVKNVTVSPDGVHLYVAGRWIIVTPEGGGHSRSAAVVFERDTGIRARIDLNNNGVIDIGDVAVIAQFFGQPAEANPAADLNGNGVIDIGNVAVIAAVFGQTVAKRTIVAKAIPGANTSALLRMQQEQLDPSRQRLTAVLSGSESVAGFQMTLHFTPGEYQFENFQAGDFLSGGDVQSLVSYEAGAPGEIHVYGILLGEYPESLPNGAGALVRFDLASMVPEPGDVRITNIQLLDGRQRLNRLADVAIAHALPTEYALFPNYPNPCNPSTTIRYQVPEDARVSIQIFDLLGRVVTTLVDEQLPAGFHRTIWNGRNTSGLRVASGIYIYRMEANSFQRTRKMLLLK